MFKTLQILFKKVRVIQEGVRDAILVSMDVKSLDANIPNCKGIKEEVIGKLNAHTDKPIPTRIIIKFLYLISAVNNFLTKSINYLQVNVCTMGNTSAPSYAKIFWESLKQHMPYIIHKAITYDT